MPFFRASTGTKNTEETENSKPKESGKTPDGQSDTEHESSAVLEILNEIQSVGNSTVGANGKSATGPQKPSGLGLLASSEVTSKSSATKISTPTMPSIALSTSKRSKTSSSEKLTNPPTPQRGGLSPRVPKIKGNDPSGTTPSSKYSPPKGEIKVVSSHFIYCSSISFTHSLSCTEFCFTAVTLER